MKPNTVELNPYHVAVYLPPVEEEVETKFKVLFPVPPMWSCQSTRTVRVGSSVVFHSYTDENQVLSRGRCFL